MKIIRLLAPAALFLSMHTADAQVYSDNIVGYMNRPFVPGYNLFVNQFDNGTGDMLSSLIPTAPNNTKVFLWNPSTGLFDTTSTYHSVTHTWSLDLTLMPGTGARLQTSTLFTNTFAGSVVTRSGVPGDIYSPPPVYSGPDGTFLMGDIEPMADTGTNIFFNILGRAPNPGEQVKILDEATQTYTISTYLGNDSWDTATPSLNPGEAAFLTVSSVPEPSTMAIGGLGATVLLIRGRFMRRKTG